MKSVRIHCGQFVAPTRLERFREVGDLTLDLEYRDARIDDRWLGLEPGEFDLFWLLAARPGEWVAGAALDVIVALAADRSDRGCASSDCRSAVEALRARLALHRLERIIVSDEAGRYCLDAPGPFLFLFDR